MVNIKDVAKKAGCSIATVSKALNGYSDVSEETKQKIQKVASEIGYMPSSFGQTLVTKKSYTIGIVFEEKTGFGLAHPFFGELLSIIKSEVEASGYDVLLMGKNVGPYIKCYLDHCLQKGVDGVIVLSADLDEDNYQRLANSKIPMVLVDFENQYKNTIYTNNYKSTKEAIQYLFDNNHREIAYVKGELYGFVGLERYNGYLDAMNELGLPINEEHIFHAPNYTTQEGVWIAEEIAKMKKRPTAVACVADAVAIGLIKGLKDRNILVPEDISVIGFDDIILASIMTPGLTTVAQNKKKIGQLVAQTLIHNINNKNQEPVHYVIDGVMVIRDTVRKL